MRHLELLVKDFFEKKMWFHHQEIIQHSNPVFEITMGMVHPAKECFLQFGFVQVYAIQIVRYLQKF